MWLTKQWLLKSNIKANRIIKNIFNAMKEKKSALFINLAKIPRAYEKLTFSKENVKGHTYVDNFSGRRKEWFICNISKMKKKRSAKVMLVWLGTEK